MERSKLILSLLFIFAICGISSIFFGTILAGEMLKIHRDLTNLPKLTETPEQVEAWNNMLLRYREAWYNSLLIGFILVLIGIASGALTLFLIKKLGG